MIVQIVAINPSTGDKSYYCAMNRIFKKGESGYLPLGASVHFVAHVTPNEYSTAALFESVL